MPRSGAQPHQRLAPGTAFTINYNYHWEDDRLLFDYDIRANVEAPAPSSGETFVGLGLGVLEGSTCMLDSMEYDSVSTYKTEVFVYDAGDATSHPKAGAWNCAALITTGLADDAPTYDAYVAPLEITTRRPQVRLSAPKSARLVRNAWTEVPVTVRVPASSIKARKVTVAGAGRGVRVRRLDLGTIRPGSTVKTHVWVRLSRARSAARLVLRDSGQRLTTKRITLRQRPAPARPRAGSWSGGGANFAVRRGKVVNFRVRTRTMCGGYPDLPTYTDNTYSFPRVAIPRNNQISQGRRGNVGKPAEYAVHLRMTFVSRNRARGVFTYNGPNRCTATQAFVATRR